MEIRSLRVETAPLEGITTWLFRRTHFSMVTTTPSDWPERARAPVPLAVNSSTRQVGRP